MKKLPTGYQNVLAYLIKEYHRVDAFKMSTDKKNERMKKAAQIAVQQLWIKVADTKPVKERDKYHEPENEHITATTHNRYLTRLRRDLEEAGVFDYDYQSNLERLIKAFPARAKDLEKLRLETYKQADKARSELLKKVKSAQKQAKRPATKQNYQTLVDALSNLQIEHPLYLELARTKTEKKHMSRRESDRKTKYQKRPRPFSGLEMIETIYRLLKTDNPENLTIGLAMACGRRCVEVLHFAELSKASNTRLNFSGMRKSKVKATETFKIPVIIEPELFLDALARLRGSDFISPFAQRLEREKVHEAEIARRLNGAVSGRLNERINWEFNGDLAPSDKGYVKWTFKDTRAIYARLAYAIYCANMKKANKTPIQEIEFFKNTLLHTDHNETLNYLQFRLTDEAALTANNIKRAKEAAEKLEFESQHDLIKTLLNDKKVMSNGTAARILPALVAHLAEHGELSINTRSLRKLFGGKSAGLTVIMEHITALRAHEPRLVVKAVKNTKTKTLVTREIEVTTTYTFTVCEVIEVQLKEGATDAQWEEALQSAAHTASHTPTDFDIDDADHIDTNWEQTGEWSEDVDDDTETE